MMDWELGFLAFREGRMREAVDRLQTAVAEHERTVMRSVRFQSLAYLGASLYTLGRSLEAAEAFQAAVRIAPVPGPPADLMVNLTNALLAAGDRDQARAVLEQTLRLAPGHIEAQMLLQRLNQVAPTEPIRGTTLGESPQAAKRYLKTLSFSRVTTGGLHPAQVKLALTQIERYMDLLTGQLLTREETIARLEAELERFRAMEDTLVENLIRSQQLADQQKAAPASPDAETGARPPLTPLEAIFQQKP